MKFLRLYLFYCSGLLLAATIGFPNWVNNIATGSLVLGWILQKTDRSTWKQFGLPRVTWPILGLCLMFVISLFYSTYLFVGFSKLETKIGLFIFPIILTSALFLPAQIDRIFKAFILGNVCMVLCCLSIATIYYYRTSDTSYFFYHQLSSPFLHAVYLSHFLVFSITLLLFGSVNWDLWIKRLLLILFFLFVMLLSSLNGLVSLFIILGIYFYLQIIKRKKFKLIMVYSVLVFVFIGFILIFDQPRNKMFKVNNLHYEMDFPSSSWNSVTIRLAMAQCAITAIQQDPIVGSGVGDEDDKLMKAYKKNNFHIGIRNKYNVHNQYLSVWIAIGTVGLVILLGVIGYPLIIAIRERDLLWLFFIVQVMLSFFTEDILSRQKGVLFFSFFYSLFIARHRLLKTG